MHYTRRYWWKKLVPPRLDTTKRKEERSLNAEAQRNKEKVWKKLGSDSEEFTKPSNAASLHSLQSKVIFGPDRASGPLQLLLYVEKKFLKVPWVALVPLVALSLHHCMLTFSFCFFMIITCASAAKLKKKTTKGDISAV